MANNSEKFLIDKLRSSNTTEVYDALLKIRKGYTRNISKMKKLQNFSAIELILPFIEHPKFCNISLSIIADVCLDLSFVEEVIKFNGVKSLVRIMESLVNDDVQNRACRALGNIAKFEIGLNAIKLVKPVPHIVKFLSETNDANCQKTAVRTLMILGNSPKTRKVIIKENGIICIAKLLQSKNTDVLTCSIKALANLTRNCSLICARQLLDLDYLKPIVDLYSHSETCVQEYVLLSLRNLSNLEEIRGGLVKVGAVKLFVDVMSKPETYEKGRLAAVALCSCLDHIHMWNHNGTDRAVGLKALLVILQNKKFHGIHVHIISSLIPLSYESKTTGVLLDLNIIRILIEILGLFIEKFKCKYVTTMNQGFSANSQLIIQNEINNKGNENEMSKLNYQNNFTVNLNENSTISEKAKDTYENLTNSVLSHKCSNATPKVFCNRRISKYSSSYSPTEICSPIRKLCTSPLFSDLDQESPVYSCSSSWSPTSDTGEYVLNNKICWSPVVSTCSKSPSPEPNFSDDHCFESEGESPLQENCNNLADNNGNFAEISSSSSYCDFVHESNIGLCKNYKEVFDEDIKYDFVHNKDSRKRKKTENLNKGEHSELILEMPLVKYKNKEIKLENSESYVKNDLINSESLTDCPEKQTIDHYIILLIFQLSFHLEKKPNSQIADRTCFTVLMDYICFIHNPSPKAEVILLNLIKNRYCFEKLVLSGFILEIEDRITSFSCSNHDLSNLKEFYLNLLNSGRQEAESDFGIGTLSHILVTAERKSQFRAMCVMSKLVTQKSALNRLLFQVNGISLLFNFLVDSCILTRRKATICLCEFYQSLTQENKSERCCFVGTCRLKVSEICSYKNAFLDVTFLLDSGEKILANRNILCLKSDYFSALLKGHFLETNSESVSLPDISAETLSTIFHFLHGCGSGKCCRYIKTLSLSVLLELLSNCDRFLLMDIKAFVEDQLCHHLHPTSISEIYAKSKIHNSPALSKRALQFALSMSTIEKDVLWNCFEKLINLDLNFNIFSDIEHLLKQLF